MAIRTKWPDPDFRRIPKTGHFCAVCQRDLKPGQPHRRVRWELDVYEFIHPDDWEQAAEEIPARRAPHLAREAVQEGVIGLDCARRIGLEWSAP